MQICGRRFDTGQPVCVEIAGSTITRVVPQAVDEVDRATWPWLAPGFLDIQVNGYGGQEFSSRELTVEKVGRIVGSFDAFGVTRCCPTVTTESVEVLEHALGTIAAACGHSAHVARRVAGVHLEGPFLSPQDGARGAHPLAHCRRPDWDLFRRLQDAAAGHIRILTVSAEFDESPGLIERVANTGVVVAIGHTSATPDQIRRAADAGARLSTHLGNGSHPSVHRLRNYIWAQLAEDRLMASLIVDGHHLPPDVVKTFIRTKSPERSILVSDMSGQAGQPPGEYRSDFCNIELLPSGKLVVAGQRELLAGAALPIGVGIPNVMRWAGVDLADAVRMATHNPAQLLGVPAGNLDPGDAADLVQFEIIESGNENPDSFELRSTVLGGEVVWGSVWQPAEGNGRPRSFVPPPKLGMSARRFDAVDESARHSA